MGIEEIVDALELAGFKYTRTEYVAGFPFLLVEGWNVTGLMTVTYDEQSGWCYVTETWVDPEDGTHEGSAGSYETRHVVSWITSQM